MPRYIIIGAGAVGGGIGGRLAAAGFSAVLVARGEHLARLKQDGIRLRSPDSDVTVAVTAVGGPDEVELRHDDVLVVATKTHQAADALASWSDAAVSLPSGGQQSAGERLPVLTALNGVTSEDFALRYFARVFGVCVWMPAVHLSPGEVILRGSPVSGMFHIGRVPTSDNDSEADQALLAQLHEDWTAAGFAVNRTDAVMRWKYRKLLSNIANAVQALVGSRGDIGPLVATAEAEARQILDAAGIDYISDADERAARARSISVRPVPGEPDELGGSTWQSLVRGTGNVESDYLNGEIVRLAHRHGLTAPVNTRIASLARRAARAGLRPGSVSAEELASALGASLRVSPWPAPPAGSAGS